jgi:tripartite ATP-independent transporter DctP family solute receptor
MRATHLVIGLAMATAVWAVAPGEAVAQTYKDEHKLSTVVGAPFPWGIAGQRWAELAAQKTGGRVKVKQYPGTSLVGGDQTREFTAIRQGVIDMAIGSTINWSPQVRQLNLFSMPFLMPDHKAIDSLTRGEVGRELFQVLERQGVIPLAWGENGFREVTNSKREIKGPADLRGLKIRVVGSPIFLETFTALGANPTQMSWADAQPALSTGAVDGQENPLTIFTVAKLHTVGQKFVTLWGYVADPLIFVVNRDVWNGWSEADRAAVRAAAEEAARENIVAARKGITPGDDGTLGDIKALGVTMTTLGDAERKAFRDATRPVYDKWAEQIGRDLVTKAERAVAAR